MKSRCSFIGDCGALDAVFVCVHVSRRMVLQVLIDQVIGVEQRNKSFFLFALYFNVLSVFCLSGNSFDYVECYIINSYMYNS